MGQDAEIISFDAFRLFKHKIILNDEPDECDRPFHRFKYVRSILGEQELDRGCIRCGTACVLVFHPSMEHPRWYESNDFDDDVA